MEPAPVPEAENAAVLYLTALERLEGAAVWDTTLETLAQAAAMPDLLDEIPGIRIPEEANRQALVADAAEEFARQLDGAAAQEVFGLLRKAGLLAQCRFDVDYGEGPSMLLPHLQKVRRLARFLSAAAAARRELTQEEAAWICIAQQLRLADHLRDEPLLISQLVRGAVHDLAEKGLRELAVCSLPSPEMGRTIHALLARMDDPAPWIRAVHGDRVFLGDWILSRPPAEIAKQLAEATEAPLPKPPTPEEIAASRAAYDEAMLRIAELMGKPYPEAIGPLRETVARAEARKDHLLRDLFSAFDAVAEKAATERARVRVTRVGLRLLAHRQAHGDYPGDLGELDPGNLPPSISEDPFTGKPLTYRQQGDSVAIYSLGPDGRDDGGRPRSANEKTGYDIAWRLPR